MHSDQIMDGWMDGWMAGCMRPRARAHASSQPAARAHALCMQSLDALRSDHALYACRTSGVPDHWSLHAYCMGRKDTIVAWATKIPADTRVHFLHIYSVFSAPVDGQSSLQEIYIQDLPTGSRSKTPSDRPRSEGVFVPSDPPLDD